MDVHGLLKDNLPAVGHLVDKMDRGARHLDAVAKGRLVDLEAVEALAAEGGDQRRMDVDDPVGPLFRKVRREDLQKSRQDNHVNLRALQRGGESGLKIRTRQRHRRDTGLFGPLQGVGAVAVGDHQGDFPVGDAPGGLGVQQSLEIGAAAGDQHGDLRLYHRTTFSADSTISPRT